MEQLEQFEKQLVESTHGIFYVRGGTDVIFDRSAICQDVEYQIESLGKSGSFSNLYRLKVSDKSNGQLAIKVPHRSRQISGKRALLAEAEALRRLSGIKGVPSLVAYGTAQIASADERHPSEWLPGLAEELYDPNEYDSIRGHLERGTLRNAVAPCFGKHRWVPTDAEITAKICLSAARILRDCHNKGVVHRDISDANIILRNENYMSCCPEEGIVDFGQSKAIREAAEADLTLTAEARGTLIFESPEINGGYPDVIHLRNRHWADLYSLGALCYYLRIGMEHSPADAVECFKASSDNGSRPGLYDLISDLYNLADGNLDKHPITQSDLKLADIIRRLTNYQPKYRGTDDETIAGLKDISVVSIGYDPRAELDDEEVKHHLLSMDTSFASIARKSICQPDTPILDTDTSDTFIPWQLHITNGISRELLPAYARGILVIGNEAVQRQYLTDNGLPEGECKVNWWNQEKTERAPWLDHAAAIEAVVAPSYPSLGDAISPKSLRAWFEGCVNLDAVINLSGIDTRYVVDMSYMFRDCTSLCEISLPASWSYSNVKAMESMFAGCRRLVTMPWFYNPYGDVSQGGEYAQKRYIARSETAAFKREDDTYELWWKFFHNGHEPLDTQNVEDFTSIFDGCNSLMRDQGFVVCLIRTDSARYLDNFFRSCGHIKGLDLTAMNTGVCTGFSSMFENCSSLERLLQHFDLTSIRWATSMFRGAERLDSVVFSNEEPRKIKDEAGVGGLVDSTGVRLHANSMFEGCHSLRTISLGSQFKSHPITDIWHMMSGCRSLETVDLTGLNTIAVQDMGGMFLNCDSLVSVAGIESFDTESVTSLGSAFKGCSSLKELDLHKWDTRNLKTIGKMCLGCTSLKRINLTGWNLNALVQGSHAFELCPSDIEIIGEDHLNAPRLNHPSQYAGIVPGGWNAPQSPYIR